MRMNTFIIMGILFLSIFLAFFLDISAYPGLIFLSGGIFYIITGIFTARKYHNNRLYLVAIAIITVSFLILTLIQVFSQSYHGDKIDSIFAVIMSLVLIWSAYDVTHKKIFFKGYEKNQKGVNYIVIAIIILILITAVLK